MKETKELSIIIVNHNTKALAMECIASVRKTAGELSYEIILVDNSTKEEEIISENAHDLTCFHIENKGFANANNFGYQYASGKYILLLNSDTVAHKGAISGCLEYLKQHSETGAVGCRVLRPDGSLDHACRRGFPTPFNSLCYFLKLYKLFPKSPAVCRYNFYHLPVEQSCEVDAITFAFAIFPRQVLEQTGLMDETFFMYGEDLDLCYRIKEAGYQIYYLADYTILHKKYQSGIAKKSDFVVWHFYNSMILFYDKHYRKKYGSLTTFAVHCGIKFLMKLKLRKSSKGKGKPHER